MTTLGQDLRRLREERRRLGAFLPVGRLLLSALRKFDPRYLWHNPVLFVTWFGAALVTVAAVVEPLVGASRTSGGAPLPSSFTWAVALAIWVTLLTATFAESLAEGRGRLQTSALRSTQESTTAHRVRRYDAAHDPGATDAETGDVSSRDLRRGDVVVVEASQTIPADGDVLWGIALVDESAITGESAPVIRESGGDRSAVTGGTKVLSDRMVVRVTATPGDTAVDRMIDLARGIHRQKAPKELALFALLASFSISFVLVALTLNATVSPVARPVAVSVLVALVVCLIPTEIAALMSVTGIASMYQLLQQGVLVDSGQALETAGDVTVVLLDKTGTITQGDRRATLLLPLTDVDEEELTHAAALSSVADPTPEGTSTLRLARARLLAIGLRVDDLDAMAGSAPSSPETSSPETSGTETSNPATPDPAPAGTTLLRAVPFSAQTRLSGADLPDGTSVRKGAESAVLAWLKHVGTQQPRTVLDDLRTVTTDVARSGGTPLVVAVKPADGPGRVLGVIHLKDVVKDVVPTRIGQLRALGARTVMLTGDNPLTAKAIAAEAGVGDYLGDATPETKLAYIKQEQARGHFVAMSGDGANDVPALAQADVGVAMNTATSAAKEAANMVILDDDPTRLVKIVEIGRRQMATRGALITFNIANDLVRYFALFPALFVGEFPGLDTLNVLALHSVASAVLSTVIFSAVVMGVLIPLALFGVPYRLTDLGRALNRNLLYYGVGGLVVAAVGIKLIDLLVTLLPGY